jgi:hypothetical protein
MKSALKLAYQRPPERIFGSPSFIARDRNPGLKSPRRFERVPKSPGSLELVNGRFVEVRGD